MALRLARELLHQPVEPSSDEAKTVSEWSVEWGMDRKLASRVIAALLAKGMLRKVRATRRRIDGANHTVTAYAVANLRIHR